MSTSTQDLKLLEWIAAGDEEALITFHRQYVNLVYSLAMRVVQNAADAEEVTQDVFLTLWNRAKTYDHDKGSITTWLITITRRRAIDYYRRQSKREARTYSLDMLDDRVPSQHSKPANIDLYKAFTELPEAQRQCIELIYFQGYTHMEVADVLNIPLGTVKGRVRLAMNKLRDFMVER